jgi:phosphatidylglycerol:prolipoprotein diacylglycerol transferase
VYPTLFQYGDLTLRSYGLMLALSFLVGIYLANARAGRHGVDPKRLRNVYVLIIVAALLGSRALYLAEHAAHHTAAGSELLQWRQSGLNMYGGVVLAALAVAGYCRKVGLPFANVADTCAPSLALGEAITRIGCFLNGCCFGDPSSLPWAMSFPPHSSAGAAFPGIAIHPTQLYAAAAHFAIFAALLAAEPKLTRAGHLIGLFLVLHAAARLGVERLRHHEPSALAVHIGGMALSPSVLVCVALLALGCYALLRARFQGQPEERLTSAAG